MMKNRKASKIGTAAAILASVFLSGTTVFGYAPMQTTEAADSVQLNETVSFVDSASNNPFANSNIYFETDEHVNILVNDSDLEPRAIICTHDFKSGYADVHNSKSNGGCEVKRYTAKNLSKMQSSCHHGLRKHNNLRQMPTQIIACTNFNGRKLAQPNY